MNELIDQTLKNLTHLYTRFPKSSHIIVGISGGVDSSVSAFLLKELGYKVTGVFMKNWEDDDTESHCSASEDIAYAISVCDHLGIPFEKINFAKDYWDRVFQYFLAEYKAGRTPNPDILCNTEIKFKAFLDYAKSDLKADAIATGHYADIQVLNNQAVLTRAIDQNKDQTYFLHGLTEAQLNQSIFPLGQIEKPKVRQIAEYIGLPTSQRKDSTGICFIGERKFKDFLNKYLPAQPGNIIDEKHQIIGKHDGLMYYTLGQRKGIGVGGLKYSGESPWYVAQKNLENNTLLIVQGHDHPLLLKSELKSNSMHWINKVNNLNIQCTAKTRYRQKDVPCFVSIDSKNPKNIRVKFTDPQWAVTPGQSVVLYQDNICLGGGVIV